MNPREDGSPQTKARRLEELSCLCAMMPAIQQNPRHNDLRSWQFLHAMPRRAKTHRLEDFDVVMVSNTIPAIHTRKSTPWAWSSKGYGTNAQTYVVYKHREASRNCGADRTPFFGRVRTLNRRSCHFGSEIRNL